ncbi:hypothetical protein AB0J57_02090 [Streptomyces sp. NPDC049837]|uniref:hypothetical protein n=1 Tax=Streptomyces sp. NPDC049837 TaxID=3155277 RepID=UPI0034468D5E
MTRSRRLAALAAGAILLVGIPVSGAHQAPPPDLGEPVVVGRTAPGPTSSSVPSPGSRATVTRTPTRSPLPGATTRTSDAYGGEGAVPPAPTGAEQPDDTAPGRADEARPVSPKAPVPAGEASDDDPTPTYSPVASASGTPSTPAGDDDGDDEDTGEDG